MASVASVASAQSVRLGGSVSTAFQVGLSECGSAAECRFLNFRNANVVQLTIDATPGTATELRGDISVRNVNFAELESLDDTGEVSKVAPVDIRVNEARLSLFDLFGAKGLDLHAGALRVAFGTGDGVNPTDRTNPVDLEEAAGFDKRLSTPAVQLGLTRGDFTVEAVVVPVFVPGLLPVQHIDFTSMGSPDEVLDLTKGDEEPPVVNQLDAKVDVPEAALENVQVGARLKYRSPIGDFSATFYRGFESLPQASGTVILTGFVTKDQIDLEVPLVYPRIMMAGLDYRGELAGSLSGWFEVAVLFPEQHGITAAENQLQALVKLGELDHVPEEIPTQILQTDDVYVQAVAGLDYLAFEEVYVNLQYARGMPSERQASDIHDYVMLAVRWTPLEGRLVLSALGTIEVAGAESLGYQAGGSVSWLHGDAAKLTLSATFLGGQAGTTFGRFEAMSNLKLSFRLGF